MSASYPFLRAVDQTTSSIAILVQHAPGPSANVTVFLTHTERYEWNSSVDGGYAEIVQNDNGNLVLVANLICRDNLLRHAEKTVEPKSQPSLRIRSAVPVPITFRVTVDGDPFDESTEVIIFP